MGTSIASPKVRNDKRDCDRTSARKGQRRPVVVGDGALSSCSTGAAQALWGGFCDTNNACDEKNIYCHAYISASGTRALLFFRLGIRSARDAEQLGEGLIYGKHAASHARQTIPVPQSRGCGFANASRQRIAYLLSPCILIVRQML